MEAADDFTENSDEDDPFTENTSNSENNNDIDTETNESNENEESENNVSSDNEENSFDTVSNDESSSDYTDKTDTPEEDDPDDPVSKVLEIIDDDTLTDYIKREQMIVGINKIIASPPSGLSSEDLKFLKVWATEWINLVSADTTKLILARLLSRHTLRAMTNKTYSLISVIIFFRMVRSCHFFFFFFPASVLSVVFLVCLFFIYNDKIIF